MSDFIVLGIIPGTNTQLTFSVWLTILLVAALLLNIRRMRMYLIILQIAHAILHPEASVLVARLERAANYAR